MTKTRSTWLANGLGIAGYIVCALQWLWLLVLFMPWFLSLEIMQAPPPERVVTPEPLVLPSLLSVVIVLAITIIAVVITIVILAKLPGVVVTKSSAVVHKTSHMVVPALMHQKKVSKKRRLQLSVRVLFIIKLVITLLPFVGLYGAIATQPPLSDLVIMYVGLWLFVPAASLFIAQRIAARLQAIDYSLLR